MARPPAYPKRSGASAASLIPKAVGGAARRGGDARLTRPSNGITGRYPPANGRPGRVSSLAGSLARAGEGETSPTWRGRVTPAARGGAEWRDWLGDGRAAPAPPRGTAAAVRSALLPKDLRKRPCPRGAHTEQSHCGRRCRRRRPLSEAGSHGTGVGPRRLGYLPSRAFFGYPQAVSTRREQVWTG